MKFIMGVLLILIILSLVRLMRGPSIWDRLLGLNLFSIKATLLILVFALDSGYAYLIDIAMAYALLSIIGLIFMCRFIEKKGKI